MVPKRAGNKKNSKLSNSKRSSFISHCTEFFKAFRNKSCDAKSDGVDVNPVTAIDPNDTCLDAMEGNKDLVNILSTTTAINSVSKYPTNDHQLTLADNIEQLTFKTNLVKQKANLTLKELPPDLLAGTLDKDPNKPEFVEIPKHIPNLSNDQMDLRRVTSKSLLSKLTNLRVTSDEVNHANEVTPDPLRNTTSQIFLTSLSLPQNEGRVNLDNGAIGSQSFDHIQHTIRMNLGLETDTSIVPEIHSLTRSFSESCLRSSPANLNLKISCHDSDDYLGTNLGYDDFFIPNKWNEKLSLVRSPSMETLPRSNHDLASECHLPAVSSEYVSNPQILAAENYQQTSYATNDVGGVSASHCNSAESYKSYYGTDSWDNIHINNQILNSVNQTICEEYSTVQHSQMPPKINSTRQQITGEKQISEEAMWRALRDKARASLPPSNRKSGRTIETLYPMNWPPMTGLDKKRVKSRTSLYLNEYDLTTRQGLINYIQQITRVHEDGTTRLVYCPSVELLEGTLIARWCKKDNRTWLWKSYTQNSSSVEQICYVTRTYADHWKKDNRTWLWKSSKRQH